MIRKTVEGREFESQMIGELNFDQTPKEGSFNPVTSDGVAKAVTEAVENLEEKIDEVTLDPSAVALGNVHLLDKATEFSAGAGVLVDSAQDGPKFMEASTLLGLTAQNTLAGNVAPAFDPTRDEDHKYLAGEIVAYEGKTCIFKVDHYGPWAAADVYEIGIFAKKFNASYFEVGLRNMTDSKYSAGNYRVRSRIGYTMPMKAGEKIVCIDSSNCYFWVEARDSNGTKTYTPNPVVSYTAPSDVSVILLLGYRNTNPITDIEALTNRFIFIGQSSTEVFVSNIVRDVGVVCNSLPAECFENGLSINLSTGNFSANNSAAVCLSSLHLKAGDFLEFEAGINHKFGVWKVFDDGTTPSGGTLTTGIVYIDNDCECIFEFYADSGYSLDVAAVAKNFKIYSQDSGTNKFIATMANEGGVSIQRLDSRLFHFGYSGVSNGVYSAIYSGFNGLVTDYLAYVHLKANDVIKVTDARYKFRVVVASAGGAPAQSSFSTGYYIIPSDADCWICIERVDGAAMSDDELLTAPSCIEIFSIFKNRNSEIRSSVNSALARKVNFDSHHAKIRLAAHRGETGLAPENTLPAFIAARQNGYDYIETDVQFTSDGVAMILHDETIDRTSNGTGKLYELNSAQVREFDFGSWMDARFAGTKIPTLEETLLLCKNLGLGIYLEFKPFGPHTFDETEVATILDLVDKYGMMGNVLFTGTSYDIVHRLRPNAGIVVGGSAIIQPTIVSQALALKGDNRVEVWGQVSDTFDEDVVLELQSNDISIGAWTSAAQNTVPVMRSVPKCCEVLVTNALDARGLFSNMSLHGWT